MTIKEQLLHKINNKTKPLGALGVLENIALQVGEIQHTLSPQIQNPHIVVFAADHGVATDGKVNPFPQAVTAQMVLNFVQGGAAINVFSKQNNIGLTVVDSGVNFDFEPSLPIVHSKIKKGTHNYTTGWAMNHEELVIALENGKKIVQTIFNNDCNTIGFGEMGIGNTSSAALIMHHYTGLPLQECVGRGTGADDAQLKTKLEVLENAAKYHVLVQNNISPHALLARIGGFEIAMMTGAYIKAYELNMLVVVDGFIATAALYSAIAILNSPKQNPVLVNGESDLLRNCIFAHCSNEQGHLKMLEKIGTKPLLNLGMRLGEGTGVALAIPVIQSAVAFLNEMASFESAGVVNKESV